MSDIPPARSKSLFPGKPDDCVDMPICSEERINRTKHKVQQIVTFMSLIFIIGLVPRLYLSVNQSKTEPTHDTGCTEAIYNMTHERSYWNIAPTTFFKAKEECGKFDGGFLLSPETSFYDSYSKV